MRILSHTVEVTRGAPQHRYTVQLVVGAERVALVRDGLGAESIDWQIAWGRWSPFAAATIEALLDEFDRRRGRSSLDDVNAELAGIRQAARAKPHAEAQRHREDRQLPAGDRA